MSDRTGIEWTDATWNPIVGCSAVSPGCANCYAAPRAWRIALAHKATLPEGARSQYEGVATRKQAIVNWTGRIGFAPRRVFEAPLRWRAARRIFVNSMGDLFHEDVPDAAIDRVFAVMALAPQHTFQVLTKRAKRMREYMANVEREALWMNAVADRLTEPGLRDRQHPILARREPWLPLPNVWLGISAEDQDRANLRGPDLLATPAAVRFVSAEPLLGGIDFGRLGTIDTLRGALPGVVDGEAREVRPNTISGMQIDSLGTLRQATIFYQTPDHMGGFSIRFPRPFPRLDWIIVGGESGPRARPMHPDWARSIRDQCKAAGVPYFHKQNGEFAPFDVRRPFCRRGNEGPMEVGEFYMTADGVIHGGNPSREAERMLRVSKRAAGRLLDGREHNAFPDAPRACRVCGCTDDRACAGGCSWVGPDLCSACASPSPASRKKASPKARGKRRAAKDPRPETQEPAR